MTEEQQRPATGNGGSHPPKPAPKSRKPGHLRYLFERDTVLATLGVFAVIGLFSLIPLNMHILDPIKIAMSDFEYNDIAYAKLQKNAGTPIDPRMVIVNIGQIDREQLAQVLQLVSNGKPLVVGLDVLFEGARDPRRDSILGRTLRQTPSLVMASRLDWERVVQGEDLLQGRVVDNFLRHKIVLLGYVSSSPNDIEDKYYTPLNEKFTGKSAPDMNGVIIQANIISMMLDGRYIHEMPHWLVYLLAFLIGWVHIAVFIRYYIDKHIWFHLVAKIAQLVSAIFFVYLGLLCFDWFDLHLNMTLTIAIIVLAIDVIYFYEALMLWLHKKFNIKTIFTLNHHVA